MERNRQSEAISRPGYDREGLVRIRKETNRATRTHQLEETEGGTCQDTERNRLSEAHSHPGDGRVRDLSGYGKKQTERGILTNWRQQSEQLVRTRERNRPRDAHSRPGDGRGSDLSGHGKK